jgi:phenylpropionate dioxygenase-like ring-hydroxylating dioxygenase large terminal subunit
VTIDDVDHIDDIGVRAIPDPPGITKAGTLPASWYADGAFFAVEREQVFRNGWVCAGVVDELPAPAEWVARSVGGTPILLVRDRSGELRGFLNVCRHRAAPLCDDAGSGSLIRCPYHAWLYRHDGSLAKAQGVGHPDGFDVADHSLKPIGVAVWRRLLFVNVGDHEARLDLGPLADAVGACPFEAMDLVSTETNDRRFNWKVLLENYSENYHTPFIHPEIDTTATEDYPMVSDGPVLYAWDRLRDPGDVPDERIRSTLLPGEPGWDSLFTADTERPYDVGSYLTIWPNAMLNMFPDAVLAMWMEPLAPNVTRVERRLYALPGRSPSDLAGILAAHRLVHDQDVDICVAVQRSHDAGLDADGVLATFEERGVYFVHEHLRSALATAE